MYFEPSKSNSSHSPLNYLRAVRYWHRPAGGVQEIVNKIKDKGLTTVSDLSKSNMELMIGSLFTMGLEESLKRQFWIAKSITEPPDFLFMTIIKDEKGRNYFHSREVEITRFVNLNCTLLQTILDKDIDYPEDYIIVCYIEQSGIENLRKLSFDVIQKLTKVRHVFVVFHGMLINEALKDMPLNQIKRMSSIVQLAPEFDYQPFDPISEVEKWKVDPGKLIYVEDMRIFEGMRTGDKYPLIV